MTVFRFFFVLLQFAAFFATARVISKIAKSETIRMCTQSDAVELGIFEGEIKRAGPNVSRRERAFLIFAFPRRLYRPGILAISSRYRGISRVASLDDNVVTSLRWYCDAKMKGVLRANRSNR